MLLVQGRESVDGWCHSMIQCRACEKTGVEGGKRSEIKGLTMGYSRYCGQVKPESGAQGHVKVYITGVKIGDAAHD